MTGYSLFSFGAYPNKTGPRARLSFDQYSHASPYGINGT